MTDFETIVALPWQLPLASVVRALLPAASAAPPDVIVIVHVSPILERTFLRVQLFSTHKIVLALIDSILSSAHHDHRRPRPYNYS